MRALHSFVLCLPLVVCLCVMAYPVVGFGIAPLPRSTFTPTISTTKTALFAGTENETKDSVNGALPEVDSMRAGEMKKELESYGISTKSMLEKKEFAEALKKARAEGKTPIKEKASSSFSGSAKTKAKSANGTEESEKDKYDKAFSQAQTMSVKDLKKELKELGVSTKSFFEKSEFVKAYAKAMSDPKASSSSRKAEEPYDPSFRDVTVEKFDKRRLAGQAVIDVSLR